MSGASRGISKVQVPSAKWAVARRCSGDASSSASRALRFWGAVQAPALAVGWVVVAVVKIGLRVVTGPIIKRVAFASQALRLIYFTNLYLLA